MDVVKVLGYAYVTIGSGSMGALGGAILGHGLNEEKGGKIGGVVGGVVCAAATTSLIATAPVVLGVCAASAAIGYGLGCWMDKSPKKA